MIPNTNACAKSRRRLSDDGARATSLLRAEIAHVRFTEQRLHDILVGRSSETRPHEALFSEDFLGQLQVHMLPRCMQHKHANKASSNDISSSARSSIDNSLQTYSARSTWPYHVLTIDRHGLVFAFCSGILPGNLAFTCTS